MNAEGQVRDLWKTGTCDDYKEVWYLLFEERLRHPSCCQTETPKSRSPTFPENEKYSTKLYLWYQRSGHLASKSMVSMSAKGLVEGLPKLDQSLESITRVCTGCLLGKLDGRLFNAKEFLRSAFNEYLSTRGMILQDISDNTPELNGIAGRNISNVMLMVLSILKGTGLPNHLRAEAIRCGPYIYNSYEVNST
jgi:hypothetical protein